MLSEEEIKYIRKLLFNRWKYFRYIVYVIIAFYVLFLGIPHSIECLEKGDIINAIFTIPIIIVGIIIHCLIICTFFEFRSGNKLFKFIREEYTVFKETMYTKHRSLANASNHKNGVFYAYYCETERHDKVEFIDEDSYNNAEKGCRVIIIQFGEDEKNTAACIIPLKFENKNSTFLEALRDNLQKHKRLP